MSTAYADPEIASDLLSSALIYISAELPSGQNTIKQSDIESIISKYAPEIAPSLVADLISTAKDMFSLVSLPPSALSSLNSAFSYIEKNSASSISAILASALNKEAPEYKLDGDIGTATGGTEDDESSTHTVGSMDNGASDSDESHTATSKPDNPSNDEESSGSTETSGASVTKMASVMVSAGAAAVGAIAMLF
ncbi:hypothetical protein EV178_002929 [Coemansia sp. RSA 1646]|nr:hypothetical protein EV178_002929 [Coemansia sp. RSA 1646]KAJ1771719.1 hypothetical protein LPJ74_002146 [Coemansia sp. RSA 1843]KAJ2210338.1 hypothetical protein EV179_006316 [Coemansia sp. RSA 487]